MKLRVVRQAWPGPFQTQSRSILYSTSTEPTVRGAPDTAFPSRAPTLLSPTQPKSVWLYPYDVKTQSIPILFLTGLEDDGQCYAHWPFIRDPNACTRHPGQPGCAPYYSLREPPSLLQHFCAIPYPRISCPWNWHFDPNAGLGPRYFTQFYSNLNRSSKPARRHEGLFEIAVSQGAKVQSAGLLVEGDGGMVTTGGVQETPDLSACLSERRATPTQTRVLRRESKATETETVKTNRRNDTYSRRGNARRRDR
ncbi:hypothetical protein EDB86DRAFT_2888539 [Lactarius hatsudake]|nr:hypothetical protein EDB86DRAFT_2888539 [Lactarius hatsudake]